MLDPVIGDIAGSRVEWHNCRSKDFELLRGSVLQAQEAFFESTPFSDDFLRKTLLAFEARFPVGK